MNCEALVTFSAEIEATLNSLPLTQISNDINDFNVLTPNIFNLGNQFLYFSPDTIKEDHVITSSRRKAVQTLTKMFWRRFIREYLPTLQIRKKLSIVHRNLKENNLVLI